MIRDKKSIKIYNELKEKGVIKMRKIVCLSMTGLLLALCSCTNSNVDEIKKKNIIDCYSIEVKDGNGKVFNYTYYFYNTKVFEYKNEKGESIYTNVKIGHFTESQEYVDSSIYLYPDRYSSDYTEYKFEGFIGYLTYENNYYLDLDDRIIDFETKYSEYLYDTNPTEEPADNKKAYECAKKNYYILSDTSVYLPYYTLKADMVETGLERHTYTKVGEDLIITFKEKWF